jgi:Fe(3+) dicitrate transport protein
MRPTILPGACGGLCTRALLVFGALIQPALAEQRENDADSPLPGVEIIGSPDAVETLPGSGTYVGEDGIREQSYDDINRVLRRIPGVYLREEDGYGLFPNISLRGVDPARSGKVMLLEDGIPQAPAPYSAPAAYFSPTTGRMSGVEVLKGSSQVRHGPQITGGVINYLSTPIPASRTGYVKGLYGDDSELRLHGYFGDTVQTQMGRIGYLAEGYYRRTDGFKRIDSAGDFFGADADETGFDNRDLNLKLMWEPETALYQRISFSHGRTDLDADETYLGLTDDDFDDTPNRRYVASRFDNIDTEQDRTVLRHFIALSDRTDIDTALYYTQFERNWFKLASVNGNNPAAALAAGGQDLDTLRGDAAGTLRYRANAREYYARGAQTKLTHLMNTGALEHEITVGVRIHEDEVDRFQQDTDFDQNDDGNITGRTNLPDGAAGDRIQNTNALALFADDRIRIGRLTISPGLRFEQLDLEYQQDLRRADGGGSPDRDSGDLSVWAGGVGLNWQHDDNWSFFGGLFRGFATPAPRSHLRSGLDEETSLSAETGIRYFSSDRSWRAEIVAFRTDFDDLIAQPNLGAGLAGDADNVGEVRSRGLELSASEDRQLPNGWRMPSFFALTYTDAQITSASTSTDPESIFSGAEKGNEVPYIPELQFSIGTGLEDERWALNLTGTYVDETFATANNTGDQIDADGNPDARFGQTDSYFVVDISGRFDLSPGLSLLAGVHNLLNDEYIVSRVPLGARPGKPRFAYAGFEARFE